jgi:phosphoribosyl-AMP cyclohydrolase
MKKVDFLSTLLVGIDVSSRKSVLCAIDYETKKQLTVSVFNNQPVAVAMAEKLQAFFSANRDKVYPLFQMTYKLNFFMGFTYY